MLNRIKQLIKNCHPYGTIIRSGYISYERQFEWWDEQNTRTYDNVKTKKTGGKNLQVRSTPCKCCSRSRQRSSPGLRLRLTALLVLIERVWLISHSIFTSTFDIWQSTFNTPEVEVADPRDICQAVLTAIFHSGVLQQLFEGLPQSLPDMTY